MGHLFSYFGLSESQEEQDKKRLKRFLDHLDIKWSTLGYDKKVAEWKDLLVKVKKKEEKEHIEELSTLFTALYELTQKHEKNVTDTYKRLETKIEMLCIRKEELEKCKRELEELHAEIRKIESRDDKINSKIKDIETDMEDLKEKLDTEIKNSIKTEKLVYEKNKCDFTESLNNYVPKVLVWIRSNVNQSVNYFKKNIKDFEIMEWKDETQYDSFKTKYDAQVLLYPVLIETNVSEAFEPIKGDYRKLYDLFDGNCIFVELHLYLHPSFKPSDVSIPSGVRQLQTVLQLHFRNTSNDIQYFDTNRIMDNNNSSPILNLTFLLSNASDKIYVEV